MDIETIRENLQGEVSYQYSRSSGPGGQNVNKVNSKVTLNWSYAECSWLSAAIKEKIATSLRNRLNSEGMIVLHSQKYRDRARNQDDCLDKLSELLLPLTLPSKVRKATRPTQKSRRARLKEKKVRSDRKVARAKVDY